MVKMLRDRAFGHDVNIQYFIDLLRFSIESLDEAVLNGYTNGGESVTQSHMAQIGEQIWRRNR